MISIDVAVFGLDLSRKAGVVVKVKNVPEFRMIAPLGVVRREWRRPAKCAIRASRRTHAINSRRLFQTRESL